MAEKERNVNPLSNGAELVTRKGRGVSARRVFPGLELERKGRDGGEKFYVLDISEGKGLSWE